MPVIGIKNIAIFDISWIFGSVKGQENKLRE